VQRTVEHFGLSERLVIITGSREAKQRREP
jgi:hypothetical protein